MISKSANYLQSNRIVKVAFSPSRPAAVLAGKLLKSSTADNRQRLGKKFLDELSASAGVKPVKLKVSDIRQYHRRANNRVVFRQYGYYRPETGYIYIQNRTPVRGEVLAARTFLGTLIHEWLHHYDSYFLKLVSIHTAGFYSRLKDLKEKLKI